MYGTGIGTGVGGGAAVFAGLAIGSWVLLAVAAACLAVMAYTLVRNSRRKAAHQRP